MFSMILISMLYCKKPERLVSCNYFNDDCNEAIQSNLPLYAGTAINRL